MKELKNANGAKTFPMLDDGQRWQAVQERDSNADGAFVFGVRSTGIYCRPSCPARRPRREQVRFFATCEAAELAGFRACRRCHPRENSRRAELVLRLCRLIEEGEDEPMRLAALGARVGMSPFHVQRIFKRALGVSPRQYAEVCRLQNFKKQLRAGASVTEAVYAAGYGSSSRAYERSAERLGMTPLRYREGGIRMRIGYTIADCELGRLLVAATDKGVCAVSLGERDAMLEAALRKEFPAAEIRRENGKLNLFVRAIQQHLRGAQVRLDLPLDVQATAFQRRVWNALREIPYGKTRSYSEIAKTIRQPKAVRAVARACATNPAALIIPCHRVVREDGKLGGYRWGLKRKVSLLAREKTV